MLSSLTVPHDVTKISPSPKSTLHLILLCTCRQQPCIGIADTIYEDFIYQVVSQSIACIRCLPLFIRCNHDQQRLCCLGQHPATRASTTPPLDPLKGKDSEARLCMIYASRKPKTLRQYASNMPPVSRRQASRMPEACRRYASRMPEVCRRVGLPRRSFCEVGVVGLYETVLSLSASPLPGPLGTLGTL